MTTRFKPDLLGTMRAMFLKEELRAVSDIQLLTRYVVEREDWAFEAILRRHGAMVLGVCRRILADAHEAEDAFQATFLVLALQAKSIVPRERLGSWLHGVAQRTALKARTTRARWRARGQQAMGRSTNPVEDSAARSDLAELLDQELAALAENYRLPIVLCDLEGKSRKDAAKQLGWLEGTLSGRLSRGRRLLATRLTRRGVTLPALGLTALLTPQALAALPPTRLLAATIKAANLWAAGQAVATGVISPKVAALTHGVLTTMLLTKLKIITGLFLVVSLVTAGTGFVAYKVLADGKVDVRQSAPQAGQAPAKDVAAQSPQQAHEATDADLKQAEADLRVAEARVAIAKEMYKHFAKALDQKLSTRVKGKIYLHRGLDLAVYDPRAKTFADLTQPDAEHRLNYQALSARLSPDGRFLAFGQAENGHPPSQLQIWDVAKSDAPTVVVNMPDHELSRWNWSPDGKQISFNAWNDKDKKYCPYVVAIGTKVVHKVELPALPGAALKGDDGPAIDAWSPDGLWFVRAKGQFYLVRRETGQVRQLTTKFTGYVGGTARFSPDGKKLLFAGWPKMGEYNLSITDLLMGETKVLTKLTNRWDFAAAWSPDSRQIVCSSVELNAAGQPTGPVRVLVYDSAGKAPPRTLLEDRDVELTVTDWR